MTNIYLEKIAAWAEDEYKNPATKSFLHAIPGSIAGAGIGGLASKLKGKGFGVGAAMGSSAGALAGMLHGAGKATMHNTNIDDRSSVDADFQKKVDQKVIQDGKRSVVGNALITPYFAGGVSAYLHNKNRYDPAVNRLSEK